MTDGSLATNAGPTRPFETQLRVGGRSRSRSAPIPPPGSRRDALSVLLPMVVAAALATVAALRALTWRDEFATREFAAMPLGDLERATRHVDLVFAPYYVLIHTGQLFGLGRLGWRGPSVVAAVAAVGLTAALARRWFGRPAGPVAGIALALNPLFLRAAADARPYALALCLAVASTTALDRAVRPGGGRQRWWAGYVVALVSAGLMHPYAVLVVIPHTALVVGRERKVVRRWAASLAVTAAVLVPLALAARPQRGQVSWIERPSPLRAPAYLVRVIDFEARPVVTAWSVAAALVVLLASAIVVMVARADFTAGRTEPVRGAAFALGLVVAPWLVLLIVSWMAFPTLATHYLVPSTVGVALILAAAAAAAAERRPAPRSRRLASPAVVLVVVLTAVTALAVALRAGQEAGRRVVHDDFASVSRTLRSRAMIGDALVVVQKFSQTGFAAGVATYAGDAGYREELRRRLVAGTQPIIDVRILTAVDPIHTRRASGADAPGRAWLVAVSTGGVSAALAALPGNRCPVDRSARPESMTFGETRLVLVTCPPAASPGRR